MIHGGLILEGIENADLGFNHSILIMIVFNSFR